MTVKLEAVDLQVGAFVGQLILRSTNEPLLCDVCAKSEAMWQHPWKKKPEGARDFAYVCFGCGGH